jgi:hypothetical protein
LYGFRAADRERADDGAADKAKMMPHQGRSQSRSSKSIMFASKPSGILAGNQVMGAVGLQRRVFETSKKKCGGWSADQQAAA